jgi:hypothetical protein
VSPAWSKVLLAPDRFNDFRGACREVIPAHRQDLLNVTLRYVDADSSSVLAYAPQPRIDAVMLARGPASHRRARRDAVQARGYKDDG